MGDDHTIKGIIMRSSCNEFNESAADRNAYGKVGHMWYQVLGAIATVWT
jgi:hypothetical protein